MKKKNNGQDNFYLYVIKHGLRGLIISSFIWNIPQSIAGIFLEPTTTPSLVASVSSFIIPPAVASVVIAFYGSKKESENRNVLKRLNEELEENKLPEQISEEEAKKMTIQFGELIEHISNLETKKVIDEYQLQNYNIDCQEEITPDYTNELTKPMTLSLKKKA